MRTNKLCNAQGKYLNVAIIWTHGHFKNNSQFAVNLFKVNNYKENNIIDNSNFIYNKSSKKKSCKFENGTLFIFCHEC